MDYSEKEIELAVNYLKGHINDIQLNYLSFKNKTETEKVKNLAKEIKNLAFTFEMLGLSLLAIAIYFVLGFFK